MRTSHYMTGVAVAGLLMLGVGCASDMPGSGSSMKQESGMKRSMQPSLYDMSG